LNSSAKSRSPPPRPPAGGLPALTTCAVDYFSAAAATSWKTARTDRPAASGRAVLASMGNVTVMPTAPRRPRSAYRSSERKRERCTGSARRKRTKKISSTERPSAMRATAPRGRRDRGGDRISNARIGGSQSAACARVGPRAQDRARTASDRVLRALGRAPLRRVEADPEAALAHRSWGAAAVASGPLAPSATIRWKNGFSGGLVGPRCPARVFQTRPSSVAEVGLAHHCGNGPIAKPSAG